MEISARSGIALRADSIGFRLPLTFFANGVEASKPEQFHLLARRIGASVSLWSRTVDRLVVDHPTLSLDVDGILKSKTEDSQEIALRDLIVENGTLVLKRGEETLFELPKIELRARNLNLGAQSGLSLAADMPQLNAVAELRVTGRPRDFSAEVSLRGKPPRSLFGAPKPSAELMRAELKLRAPKEQPIDALIEGNFHSLELAGNKVTGSLAAKAALDAQLTAATFSGKAVIADFPANFRAIPLKLPNGVLSANLAGDYSVANKLLRVKSVHLSAPFGSAIGAGRFSFGAETAIAHAQATLRDIPLALLKENFPPPLNQWSYQGSTQVAIEAQGPWRAPIVKGVAESDSLQVRGEDFTAASLALSAPFEWSPPSLRFQEIKLRATKLAYAPKARWHAAAEKVEVESSFEYLADQPVKIGGRVAVAGAKFASPDASKVGENLSVGGPFELTADRQKQTSKIAGKFTAESGELLWGKFFGDVKSQRPVLELDADYLRGEDRVLCRRCQLQLAAVGALEVAGAIAGVGTTAELRLQATSKNFSPSGFFEFFLRETFNRQYPALDNFAIGGQMAFDLALDGPLDAFSAVGELTLKGGELRAKSNAWRIGPIALDLPLSIHLGENKMAARAPARRGKLTVESIRFAGQTVAPFTTTLALTDNSLRSHQPIAIGVFGGAIIVDKLFWPDLINDPKRVSFAAETRRLQLDELTQALNWPRFSGTLTGSIPEVQAAGDLLSTRGEIQAELFGGRVRVSKLEIGNPFSPLASIKFDARLDGVELEQLTRTFAFGRISGILEGSIENMILIDGQPSELSAELHSVDRGGEQRISVEALNKITVLSSGEDAGALYGGLAGFFDSFRYSKLGFKVALKNDRLTLRGVESRAGQEMLVVGSFLPPTVNIVSHTQNIAFSELLRRLERINKTTKPDVK